MTPVIDMGCAAPGHAQLQNRAAIQPIRRQGCLELSIPESLRSYAHEALRVPVHKVLQPSSVLPPYARLRQSALLLVQSATYSIDILKQAAMNVVPKSHSMYSWTRSSSPLAVSVLSQVKARRETIGQLVPNTGE